MNELGLIKELPNATILLSSLNATLATALAKGMPFWHVDPINELFDAKAVDAERTEACLT